MLNCLLALTFQIVGATSVLFVHSLRWLLLLKSKDEQNHPSPPLHPGKVHGAPLSSTSPCLGQGGASIQGPDQGKTTRASESRGHAAYIQRNDPPKRNPRIRRNQDPEKAIRI